VSCFFYYSLPALFIFLLYSFLDDLERVTSLRYTPSDDDVLKARLKTVGVSEYKFEMEVSAGRDSGTEWRIVDVGGSRSQRREFVIFFTNDYHHTHTRTMLISQGGL
jgi:hypothetical protein